MYRILLALLPLCLLLTVPATASAERIIADSDSCADQGGGDIRCCGNSGTRCHDYSDCSMITDSNSSYQGAWRCASVVIYCEEGDGTDFSECDVQLLPAQQERTMGGTDGMTPR